MSLGRLSVEKVEIEVDLLPSIVLKFLGGVGEGRLDARVDSICQSSEVAF